MDLSRLVKANLYVEMFWIKAGSLLVDAEIEQVHKEAIPRANEQYLTCLLIALVDEGRCLELKQELRNVYLFKQDK